MGQRGEGWVTLQAVLLICMPPPRRQAGATHGTYELVRHPIYSAVILGAAGIGLITENRLRLAMIASLFLDRKARVEESWLQEKHLDYGAYKAPVKKLIPWVY